MKSGHLGWRRLIIAVFGLWAAFWLGLGLISAWFSNSFSDAFIELSRAFHIHEAIAMDKLARQWSELMQLSMAWGVGGLLVGAVVLPITVWVVRGFQTPRQ